MRFVALLLLAACGPVEPPPSLPPAPHTPTAGVPIWYDYDAWAGICQKLLCPKPIGYPEANYPDEFGYGCVCVNDAACVKEDPTWLGKPNGCQGVPWWPSIEG